MKIITIIVSLLLSGNVFALEWQENSKIAELFSNEGIKGTFVLYDVSEERYTGYNIERAEKRFMPASTFKIPNSLIGLSSSAVKTVDDILPYGGKPQFLKSWENDMSLRDAIKISNVPIYQELARRIGLQSMQDNVTKLKYGNMNIGNIVDTFWLEGPLKISAMEQVNFLSQLALNTLPYPAEIQNQVREITKLEESDGRVLYGKTGWTTAPNPDIGWWVGWVTHNDKIYSFALNMDMDTDEYANKRIEIGRAILKILGLY